MRFAKIGEEVFERQAEITCEELRLYIFVCFHSFPDESGIRICRRSIEEICSIYGLDYDNTCRRYKRLRTGKFSKSEKPKKVAPMTSPWLRQTSQGIIPLVGFTVKNTVFEEEETVKNTVSDCKKYSGKGKKTVKNTVLFKGRKKSLKNPNTTRESVRVNENGHQSEFSLAECLRYVELEIATGARINNPHALAQTLYKTGESDIFIRSKLYPEAAENRSGAEEHSDCPRCYGQGIEYRYDIDGEFIGLFANCQHLPLQEGEYLWIWRQKNG